MAETAESAASLERLMLLDQQIEGARAELDEVLARRGRLKDDYDTSVQLETAARHAPR